MKKVFALILALVMVFAMSSVAFATTDTLEGGTPNGVDNWKKSGDVTVTLGTGQAQKVYYVEIIWGNLTFTYDKTADVWNPKNHSYTAGSTSGWQSNDGATVAVKNHSNDTVTVSAEFVDNNSNDGVSATVAVTDGSGNLPTAENTTVENAPKVVYTVTPNGVPATNFTGGVIGNITVAISHTDT